MLILVAQGLLLVRAKKLAQVQADFNKFDTKHTKQKFDVGGRKIAGATGRPAQSKSLGIENVRLAMLSDTGLLC